MAALAASGVRREKVSISDPPDARTAAAIRSARSAACSGGRSNALERPPIRTATRGWGRGAMRSAKAGAASAMRPGRDAVGRAGDLEDIVARQAVMGGGDDHVIAVVRPARVLGLDDEGLAPAPGLHLRRQGQGGAARRDPQIGPGRDDRIGCGRQHGRRLQGRRQAVEDGPPADVFDRDFGRGQALNGLGQPQGLVLDPGAAVRDDPNA